MQYDLDMRSEYREIFIALRDIVLSNEYVHEKKNDKQTAYYDQYSAVCFLRPDRTCNNGYCISFAKGHKLQATFPTLKGSGKITRHLYFNSVNDINKKNLKDIIDETIILNIEAYELKKLAKKV